MALDRIEQLVEKYFEAQTSIAEENELKVYFSSSDVAQHLQQYQSLFGYFTSAKEEKSSATIPLKTKQRKYVAWLSIAASVSVLLGIGSFVYMNNQQNATVASSEYGTYDSPEKALKETQKALALLSHHVNTGIESVNYITEYESSKDKIFKE